MVWGAGGSAACLWPWSEAAPLRLMRCSSSCSGCWPMATPGREQEGAPPPAGWGWEDGRRCLPGVQAPDSTWCSQPPLAPVARGHSAPPADGAAMLGGGGRVLLNTVQHAGQPHGRWPRWQEDRRAMTDAWPTCHHSHSQARLASGSRPLPQTPNRGTISLFQQSSRAQTDADE